MQIKQYVFVSSIFINKYVYFYFWGQRYKKKKKLRIISAGKYGFASVVSKHKKTAVLPERFPTATTVTKQTTNDNITKTNLF